jgi:hypothetical protein
MEVVKHYISSFIWLLPVEKKPYTCIVVVPPWYRKQEIIMVLMLLGIAQKIFTDSPTT